MLNFKKGGKMPEQNTNNPFDTREDELALMGIEKELAQARESIESNFAKHAAQNTDEKLEELFFSDKEAFYLQVLQMQNAFLEDQFGSKLKQEEELKGRISQKKAFGSIDEAANAFQQAHPEANVNELMQFYSEEVPSKIQLMLDKLDPNQFFDELYKIYQSVQGTPTQQGQAPQQLPRELKGAPSQAGTEGQNNSNLPFERL